MTTEALQSFDQMMLECTVKVDNFAAIAKLAWADTLEELERRGKAKLVSGSFDDLGNALVTRLD